MHLKSCIPSKHITVPIFTIPEHTVLPCCMLIKNTKQKWGNISRIKNIKLLHGEFKKPIHKLLYLVSNMD